MTSIVIVPPRPIGWSVAQTPCGRLVRQFGSWAIHCWASSRAEWAKARASSASVARAVDRAAERAAYSADSPITATISDIPSIRT
jgi:hypothetical protein